MNEEVKVFKALGDETRLKILVLLSNKNVCAMGIAKNLEISEACVSQHIKILKEAILITAYKEGYYVMYELNKEVLERTKGFVNLLIHEDIDSLNNKYNFKIGDFNIVKCKSIKCCCRKKFKEEL